MQIKPKISRKNKTIQITVEFNEIGYGHEWRNNKTEALRKNSKIDKFLIFNKVEVQTGSNIQNERRSKSVDVTDIKCIIRKYCKHLSGNIFISYMKWTILLEDANHQTNKNLSHAALLRFLNEFRPWRPPGTGLGGRTFLFRVSLCGISCDSWTPHSSPLLADALLLFVLLEDMKRQVSI